MEDFVKLLCLPCYVEKNMNGVMTHNSACTAITCYLAICVVNDYKHNSSVTINYFNYGFITNKSTFRK